MRHLPTLCALLLAACSSSPQPNSNRDRLIAVAMTLGDPVVAIYGYALVEEHAPELLPVLDGNGDKILTVAEVRTAAESVTEAQAAVLLAQVVARLAK